MRNKLLAAALSPILVSASPLEAPDNASLFKELQEDACKIFELGAKALAIAKTEETRLSQGNPIKQTWSKNGRSWVVHQVNHDERIDQGLILDIEGTKRCFRLDSELERGLGITTQESGERLAFTKIEHCHNRDNTTSSLSAWVTAESGPSLIVNTDDTKAVAIYGTQTATAQRSECP